MYNYMFDQLQNLNLQMQPQAVPVYYLSVYKVTYHNIFVSVDLDTDLYPVHTIARVFRKTPNHDPHTSRLWTQTRIFTPISCDLEPEITERTSRKIIVSYDLAPDPSACINSKGLIAQGFRGTFLLNFLCNNFEKVDEGRKMSSQLWVRMAGYRNYISCRYGFISSFVSLIKYVGQNLNNLMWLRMAVHRNDISYIYVFISSFASLTKYAGRKLKNIMWLRMAGEFMSIYFFGYSLSS